MKIYVIRCPYTLAAIAIISPFMASCEKELDFHYHDVKPQLVIEGSVSDRGACVSLTITTPMDEPMDLSPVTDADVSLTDITAGISRVLTLDTDGTFTDNEPGIPGHEYRLDVVRDDCSYSATSLMRPSPEILSLGFQWIRMPYDHVAVLQVEFSDPDTMDDCYWIRLYKNGDPYKWLLSDDSHASSGVISETTFTSRMDLDEEDEKSALRDGDVMEVSVTPVSRAVYDYLTALESDSNGPRMFTGDFCLGYFIAASDAVASVVFHPDRIPGYNK